MAENKKISELNQIQNLSDNDEFVIVDKSTTSGTDASSTGKTAKATLWQLKDAISASGEKGQKGQPGQDGDTGLPGKDGNDGPRGYKGDRGDRGYKGETGQKGFMGDDGPRGYKGQRGEAGMPGAPGDPGVPGERGYKGDVGDPGATGFKGQKGEGGKNGNAGPAGDPGKSGDKGDKGSVGRSGQDGNVIHFLQIKGTNLGARDAGQSLVKTSSINSWSTGYGFSTVGFSSASSLVVSPASNKNVFLIGLSSSPATTGLTDAKSKINAGWYFDSDGQAYVWAAGKKQQDLRRPYTTSSNFEVRYTGYTIVFYENGSYVAHIRLKSSYTMYLGVAIYTANAEVTSTFNYVASGATGYTGQKGVKGEPGSGSAGPGGQGPAGEKGQKGASITGNPGSDGSKGEKGLPGEPGSSTVSKDASNITTGTFHADRIPNLSASKITSGTFATARIPNIDASKIASGKLHKDRITELSKNVKYDNRIIIYNDLVSKNNDMQFGQLYLNCAGLGHSNNRKYFTYINAVDYSGNDLVDNGSDLRKARGATLQFGRRKIAQDADWNLTGGTLENTLKPYGEFSEAGFDIAEGLAVGKNSYIKGKLEVGYEQNNDAEIQIGNDVPNQNASAKNKLTLGSCGQIITSENLNDQTVYLTCNTRYEHNKWKYIKDGKSCILAINQSGIRVWNAPEGKKGAVVPDYVQSLRTTADGDLEVHGRIKTGYQHSVLQFSGSATCGIAHDGNLVSSQMSPHNSHQAIVRGFDLSTGRHLQLIEPTKNIGKSNPKYSSGFNLGGYHYGAFTQAEFHNTNQTEKDRSKTTILYWTVHAMVHRIEYNIATNEYSSKSLGRTNTSPDHYWACFATYNSGNAYDTMLYHRPDPHSSYNPDNHIYISKYDYNGSGYTQDSYRYLALSKVSGYKEMVNVDSDSYAFMSIMGINPWSGRVYIWGADDAGSMMHTFQIKSSLRSPGQAWVQVLWNNISQSHGPNYTYGNMGGLEYIHSHKLPYVNEYVNNDASSYNKVITFDPKTKLPETITISAYGNDHGSGGTKVIYWNNAWT